MQQATHREDDPRVLVKDVREAMSEAADLITRYSEDIKAGDPGKRLQQALSEIGWASMKLARLEAIL